MHTLHHIYIREVHTDYATYIIYIEEVHTDITFTEVT